LSLNERWSGSKWYNFRRDTYTYDSNGNMILYLTEYPGDAPWENYSQSTYTYDSNNNMILELRIMWYGEWQNDSQTTYTYDSNGNLTLKLSEWWGEEAQWKNDERKTYSYDTNDNMTLELSEWWGSEQWNNSLRITYTYDPNGNITLVLNKKWYESQWILSENYFSFYDSFGKYFGFSGSEIKLFYSTLTDISEDNLNITNYTLLQNYPNPFNPSTKIKYSIPSVETYGHASVQLVVYDILGREVAELVNEQQKPGYYEVQFDASKLTSGVYFYKLQAGSFLQTKKMILLR